jgi:hypothetical protein
VDNEYAHVVFGQPDRLHRHMYGHQQTGKCLGIFLGPWVRRAPHRRHGVSTLGRAVTSRMQANDITRERVRRLAGIHAGDAKVLSVYVDLDPS